MIAPASLYENVLNGIGNTPMVKLNKIIPENCADIFVKLEYYNPTGSYKDRMADAIIAEAEKRGALTKGMVVAECTGGSTGTSLAFVCAVKGYRFRIVSSDAFAKEKLQSMRLFGAELEIFKSDGGKITLDLIPSMIKRTQEIFEEGNVYLTRQFENKDVIEGYKKMGEEIIQQLNKPIDAFCASVGTAGMAMGVSAVLKKYNPAVRTIILEPASAPLISGGVKGTHTIDGIGVGFIPPLLDKNLYNEARAIEEKIARDMARKLAKEEGIFAGTSTGVNIAAAVALGLELGHGKTVVTVACDSGMKYLASSLFD